MSFTANRDYGLCVERMGRDLPALPEVISELTTNLNDPNSATFTIEKLMNSDQSLSMKVLNAANTTAFRGDRQRITEVHEAIGMLGYENIRNIILTSSVMNLFSGISMDVMSFEDLWRHSLITAELTKTLAEKTHFGDSDKAFICGLLHDIGKVGRVKGDERVFEADLSQAIAGNLSLFEVEAENQSLRHDRLGQALCRKWNLPSIICNVVGNHHEFELVDRDEGMQEQDHEVTDLIIVANALANYWGFGFTSHSSVRELPRTLLNRVDLNQEKLVGMEDELRDRIASVIEFNRILISLPLEPGTRIKKNLGIKEDKDLFRRSLSEPDPSSEDVEEDDEEDQLGGISSNDFFASFTPLTQFSSQFSSAVRERLTSDQEKIFLDSLRKRFPQDARLEELHSSVDFTESDSHSSKAKSKDPDEAIEISDAALHSDWVGMIAPISDSDDEFTVKPVALSEEREQALLNEIRSTISEQSNNEDLLTESAQLSDLMDADEDAGTPKLSDRQMDELMGEVRKRFGG